MSVATYKVTCANCGHEKQQQRDVPPTPRPAHEVPFVEVVLACEVCTSKPYQLLKAQNVQLQQQLGAMCDDDTGSRGAS